MSKKQIRPGMLCYLRQTLFPENNGRPVTTIEKKEINGFGVMWLVESPVKLKCVGLRADGGIEQDFGSHNKMNVYEGNLIPIDDNPDNTENESWFLPAPALVEKKTNLVS